MAQVWILKGTLNSYLIIITTYHPWSFLLLSFQYVHNLTCYLSFHHLLLSQTARLPKHLLCSPNWLFFLSLSPPKASFTQKSERSFQNTNKIIALFGKPITYRVKTKSHTSGRICLIHLLLSSPTSYTMYSITPATSNFFQFWKCNVPLWDKGFAHSLTL